MYEAAYGFPQELIDLIVKEFGMPLVPFSGEIDETDEYRREAHLVEMVAHFAANPETIRKLEEQLMREG